MNNPGKSGIGHQWCYLPDMAATEMTLLARRESFAPFASFPMAGHWDASGTQRVESVQRVTGNRGPKPAITNFPWWRVYLLSPVMPTMRELLEMRYLWQQPVQLDNSRLIDALGHEPHTPLDEAVKTTLVDLKCL
ncbi:hypothetical protein BS639_19800 [Rouxiella silvae]|nr:hypothetical protein BS639_19800 [Rouxiella silvae]